MTKKIYPSKDRVILDGGLNTKFEKAIIGDNESPECLNVVFDNGAVGTRQGYTKLNTVAIDSAKCDGLYTRVTNSGAETMVAFYNGTMYGLSGASFITVGSAQSVYTAGQRMHTAQYENYMFLGNGGISPYKYNGAFTLHGIPAPTATMTAATASNGTITGDYRYKLTNVNTNLVESDVGPIAATFAAAAESILVTDIPTAPASHGVNTRKLYRTESSGSTFLLLTTISDNSTTSYTDNSSDSELGAEAPTDQGNPPNYSTIVYHQDRLFMNDPDNPNYVWYTELGNPYVVKATNFIRIGDNAGDIVQALGVYENGVVAFGEESVTVIYMPDTTSSNWVTLKGKSAFGSKSRFGIITYNNKLLFPAVQADKFLGFAALEGITTEPSTTFLSKVVAGSQLKSDKVEPDMFSVQESYLDNISSIVYKQKAYIGVTYGSGNVINNRIYVFDFSISNLNKNQEFSWSPWTGMNPQDFTIYNGNLYFATSDTTGFIYQLNDGTYNDDGSAINSYFKTKDFSGGSSDVNYQKDFRTINLLLDRPGDYSMEVDTIIDSNEDDSQLQTINLNPGGRLWGTMEWQSAAVAIKDTNYWGGSKDVDESRLFLGGAGKRVQFKFTNSNTTNQRFKVHGINYVYNTKGYR